MKHTLNTLVLLSKTHGCQYGYGPGTSSGYPHHA